MKTDALLELKECASDVLYQNLVSTDKSSELAIEFLKLNIKERRLTYHQIKKISDYYADFLVDALNALGSVNPGPKDKDKLVRESLDKAWKKYKEEIRG